MRIILWVRAERLGHEADLHVRFQVAFQIGVENAIYNRPVVNRFAAGVLAVSAGGTPLQRGRSIAAGEQMVAADVYLRTAKLPELGEQLLAVLHISVVRLIVAEEAPDGRQFADGLCGIHTDSNGKWRGRCGSGRRGRTLCATVRAHRRGD